ncbi:MAG: hypothetical protein LBC71_00470 [Oscillospiraceae bacterium]|jgi:hypothetical protein|nr:hypothetical protein [Oscillospiraceae bacterium]
MKKTAVLLVLIFILSVVCVACNPESHFGLYKNATFNGTINVTSTSNATLTRVFVG